jgi:hypothetical protein
VSSLSIPNQSMATAKDDQNHQNENAAAALHRSFDLLQLKPELSDPRSNCDFRVTANSLQRETRGRFLVAPPARWKQYDCNNRWGGVENGAGESAVVYHGTKSQFVSSIIQNSLRPGGGNCCGYGIYCSPNPLRCSKHKPPSEESNAGTCSRVA